MSTQDFLNLFLILALVVFISCIVFTTFFLIQALKAVTSLAEDLKETTQGLKDKAGIKMLAAVPAVLVALLGRILKRRG